MKQHRHFSNVWLSYKLFKIPPTSLIQLKPFWVNLWSKNWLCSSLCYLKYVFKIWLKKADLKKSPFSFTSNFLLGEEGLQMFNIMFFALRAIHLLFKEEWGSNSHSSIENTQILIQWQYPSLHESCPKSYSEIDVMPFPFWHWDKPLQRKKKFVPLWKWSSEKDTMLAAIDEEAYV